MNFHCQRIHAAFFLVFLANFRLTSFFALVKNSSTIPVLAQNSLEFSSPNRVNDLNPWLKTPALSLEEFGRQNPKRHSGALDMGIPTTGNSITERVTYTGMSIPEAPRKENAVVVAGPVEHKPSGAKNEGRQEPIRF